MHGTLLTSQTHAPIAPAGDTRRDEPVGGPHPATVRYLKKIFEPEDRTPQLNRSTLEHVGTSFTWLPALAPALLTTAPGLSILPG
jgi:hypothetical protein